MIGSTGQGSGFGGLEAYLMRGHGEVDPAERVAWTSTRNLLFEDPQWAPTEMHAVASQNPRVEKPVYHVSLNAAPGEHLSREQWEQVADRVLKALDLEEHQALIVAHKDRPHEHIHVVVNRVHPVTHRTANLYRDWPRIEKVLREVERDFALRQVPGHHARDAGQEPPDRAAGLTSGERREQLRTGEEPWAEQMRFRLYNDVKEASSWADLETRLAGHGVHLETRGRGLVVTDGERQVKLSRIHRGRSAHKLAERFGESWADWRSRAADPASEDASAEALLAVNQGGPPPDPPARRFEPPERLAPSSPASSRPPADPERPRAREQPRRPAEPTGPTLTEAAPPAPSVPRDEPGPPAREVSRLSRRPPKAPDAPERISSPLEEATRDAVEQAPTWLDLEARLAHRNLRLGAAEGGELAVTDGQTSLHLSELGASASRRSLEERLGSFEGYRREAADLVQAVQTYETVQHRVERMREAEATLEQIRSKRQPVEDLARLNLAEMRSLRGQIQKIYHGQDAPAVAARLETALRRGEVRGLAEQLRTHPEHLGTLADRFRTEAEPDPIVAAGRRVLVRLDGNLASRGLEDLDTRRGELREALRRSVDMPPHAGLPTLAEPLREQRRLLREAQQTARRAQLDLERLPELGELEERIDRGLEALEARLEVSGGQLVLRDSASQPTDPYELPLPSHPGAAREAAGPSRPSRGEPPWAEPLRSALPEQIRESPTWLDFEARLAEHRVRLEPAEPGAEPVVTDGRHRLPLSDLAPQATGERLAQRFGVGFEEHRSQIEELQRLARSYETVRQQTRPHQAEVSRAESAFKPLEEARSVPKALARRNRDLASTLRHQLAGIYRPEDVPAVRRTLQGALRRGEASTVADQLVVKPERFGRLLGRGAMVPNLERREALDGVHAAAETLRRLDSGRHELREALHRYASVPSGVSREHLAQALRTRGTAYRQALRTLEQARAALKRLPDAHRLLRAIGRQARRMGLRLAESSLAGRGVTRTLRRRVSTVTSGARLARASLSGRAARTAGRATLRTATGLATRALGVTIPGPVRGVVSLAMTLGRSSLGRGGQGEGRG